MTDNGLQRYDTFLARVRATRKRILVVGDLLTDIYVDGKLARMAPEGGAAVFEERSRWDVWGGAGNVVAQLRVWNVDADGLYRNAAGTGISGTKTRYIADGRLVMVASNDHPQQPISKESMQLALRQFGEPIDALLVADYGKGAITTEIAHALVDEAKKRCIHIIVDPRPSPEVDCDRRWSGASLLKMNLHQWEKRRSGLAGDWMDARKIDSLVVTRGQATPVTRSARENYADCRDRPAYLPAVDCSGAGDHFAAVLAVGIVHGLTVSEAAEFAHEASKLRVAYRRPRPILPAEVRGQFDRPLGKILSAEDVGTLLTHRAGKKIVFTNGCFDPLTPGHQTLLDFARQQGDILVVGVNDDESVARLKVGRPLVPCPLVPCEQRARMLAGMEAVSFVIPFAETTPLQTMEKLGKIHVLVKGDEYESQVIPGSELADSVVFAPTVYSEHASDWIRKSAELVS